MTWRNLKGEFQGLLAQAQALQRDSRALRPTIGLLLNHATLEAVVERADRLYESFSQADGRLAQSGNLDVGFNGQVMEAASYVIVASARESVRSLIHEIYGDINDIRSRLNNLVTVALALVAIATSIVGILL